MAAPKQNSPVQATESSTLKAAPQDPPAMKDPPSGTPATPHNAASTHMTFPMDPPAADATEPVEDPPELTYAGTEASAAYCTAKILLNDGEFDQALEIIGNAMARTMSRLPEESGTLHECMAPFYYLYGTTLLYSIEESSDNLGPEAPDEEDGGEDAEDIQIAWENLETSRHIVSMMRGKDSTDDKLTLDLAQIHMRLGDVQKANDRSAEALEDYRRALELRQPLLGMYNRKVADLYMQSAMVYMTLASAEGVSDAQKGEYTNQALEHYMACGKSFAGLIAFTCGHNPEVVTKDPEIFVGGKTSGMTEDELRVNQMSLTLKNIRDRVATMGVNDEQVHEWKEILTEIQETIDEAEQAGKAMTEVTEMKIQAKMAADAEVDTPNLDGSSTSIGFGGVTVAAVMANVTSLDVASTGGAKPMMVVRKKKKLDPPENDQKMPDEGNMSKRTKNV